MSGIAAGIVTYNPDLQRLTENVNAVLPQVDCLIIVDNASKNVEQIKKTFGEDNKIRIIENDENKGIATALNQILQASVEEGAEWSLTLDGDSVVPENMIEQYEKYLDVENVAMIVPVIQDRKMQLIDVEEDTLTNAYDFVDTAITSGTLMKNSIWQQLHGFEDKLFIDYVDFDYCMRVKIAGYQILRVNSVKLLHELGNATEIKLFTFLGKIFGKNSAIGRRFWEMRYTTNHSPMRVYYVTRNQYYYIKHYADYIDEKKLLRGMKIGWGVKLIFEKDRIKKWKAIRRGIADGKKM